MPVYSEILEKVEGTYQFDNSIQLRGETNIYNALQPFFSGSTGFGVHIAVICSDEKDPNLSRERFKQKLSDAQGTTYEEIDLKKSPASIGISAVFFSEEGSIIDILNRTVACCEWMIGRTFDDKEDPKAAIHYLEKQIRKGKTANSIYLQTFAEDFSEGIKGETDLSSLRIIALFTVRREWFSYFSDKALFFPAEIKCVVKCLSEQEIAEGYIEQSKIITQLKKELAQLEKELAKNKEDDEKIVQLILGVKKINTKTSIEELNCFITSELPEIVDILKKLEYTPEKIQNIKNRLRLRLEEVKNWNKGEKDNR